MDPNNNLEPVIDTAALEAAMADMNPAASVADAAMGGATPVVTTTDDMASDVAPEPTLQAPTLEAPVAPVAPETPVEGPVSLAPSADFQMSETATVSALQNGADGNLAAQNTAIMIGQPLEQTPAETPLTEVGTAPAPEENTGMAAPDFSNPDGEMQPEQPAPVAKPEEDDEPLVAAAPVPGSIGSAKSYADIQRAEAEKAAKMAAKTSQKGAMDKKTIMIIAAIAAVVVAIVAIIIVMIVSNKPAQVKPTPVAPVEENHEYSTLSCKRNLAPEEYASYGAISGIQENIFYFQDDELDGLVTNFAYTYANKALSDIATENFKRDYGVTEETEAETEDEEEEQETEKTTAEMLKHYVTTKDYTVTHGMEIKSEDIKAWLESDAYSDVTYGAIKNSDPESEEEVTRNLKFYNRLQNSINYTCTIDKSN